MTSGDYSQHVPAAERTLRVLEALSADAHGLATADLLTEVGGSRSGLYALLNTLRSREYVVTEEGRHRLGPALWQLVPDRPRDMETLVAALVEESAPGGVTETMAITWPHHGGTIVVAEVQADEGVRVVYRVGSTRPPQAPDSRLFAAAEAGKGADLGRIRRRGGVIVVSDDMTEIAVPVCRDGVRPTAAILAGIPAQRGSDKTVTAIERELRRLAARLSHRLGAAVYKPYGWAPAEPVGPSRELDRSELDEFLSGLWGAQLACVRSDGTPHVVPLWYEWDGSAIWLAASPGSSWRAHVADNPEVSITLDEPWPPLRRVFLSGVAREVPDTEVPGGLAGLRSRLATRYLGQGAERQAELSDVEGWTAIRISPDRIHGRQGLGPIPVETAAS